MLTSLQGWKQCTSLIAALAFVGALSVPAQLLAQTASETDNASVVGAGSADTGSAGTGSAGTGSAGTGSATVNVYSWKQIPAGQQMKIASVTFDQTGYQLTSVKGDIIEVPFVNQNLFAMRFSASETGQPYLVNDGDPESPSLFVPANFNLTSPQNADVHWQPLPNDSANTGPIYVSPAPTMADYSNLNFYPKMTIYGGVWGYTTARSANYTRGYYISIDGKRFSNYYAYVNYYRSNPGNPYVAIPVNGVVSGPSGSYVVHNGIRVNTNGFVPSATPPPGQASSRAAGASAPVQSGGRVTGSTRPSLPSNERTIEHSIEHSNERSIERSNPTPPVNQRTPGFSPPAPVNHPAPQQKRPALPEKRRL